MSRIEDNSSGKSEGEIAHRLLRLRVLLLDPGLMQGDHISYAGDNGIIQIGRNGVTIIKEDFDDGPTNHMGQTETVRLDKLTIADDSWVRAVSVIDAGKTESAVGSGFHDYRNTVTEDYFGVDERLSFDKSGPVKTRIELSLSDTAEHFDVKVFTQEKTSESSWDLYQSFGGTYRP